MNTTTVFNKNLDAYNAKKRYIVNKGSTRSSKTYSQLQLLFLISELSTNPKIISIVSESMPHLKRGCIRDFKEILQNEGKWDEANWNATDKIYKVNNSIIEFFSADNPAKVHGPSRNILYLNECINIEYEIYRQLAIRTTETIFLDCNPSFEFWLDEKILPLRDDACLIHSTYKDNEYLSEDQIKEIESNKSDTNWWRVYGEGLTGSLQGVVVLNWDIVSEMPTEYKKRWLGIDFGFSNDPTAIVDVRLSGGELWINELLYSTGYDNMMIAEFLEAISIPKDLDIVADCQEPKSIVEIRSKGWRVEPSKKGKDSIITGISILNRYKKHVTQTSLNIIKEYRNYRWNIDEFGNPTNTPIDKFNHSIDAQRYVCLNKLIERNNNLSYSIIKGKR
jgi:phage terminase large subunit